MNQQLELALAVLELRTTELNLSLADVARHRRWVDAELARAAAYAAALADGATKTAVPLRCQPGTRRMIV